MLLAAMFAVAMLSACANPFHLRPLKTAAEPGQPDERRVVAHAIFVDNDGHWKPGTAGCEEIKRNPVHVEATRR